MGRSPKQINKGKYSSSYYFQDKYKGADGKRLLKLRLKVKGQNPVDLGVKLNGKKISIIESHFQNGRVINGYDHNTLMDINILLAQISKRSIQIGDEAYKSGNVLNADKLFRLLYSPTPNQIIEIGEPPIKTIHLKEHNVDVQVSQNDIDLFEAEKISGYLKDKNFDGNNELSNVSVLRNIEKGIQQTKDQIEKLPLQDRFVKTPVFDDSPNEILGFEVEPDTWNNKNIFDCLGYITYGTRIDAMGDKEPLIAPAYKGLLKKLLYYKVNATPYEDIRYFNEEWVHEFYRFIYYNGFERRLHRLHTNPFGDLSEYKIRPDSKFEKYGVNSFGEGIHKHMKAYIKALYKNGLIKEDFTEKLDAGAFTKQYNKNLSSYGESIYNLTIQEFLTILKANLEKGSNLDKIRDAFVVAVMLGGLRYKNQKGEKVFQQLDHFNLVGFKQAKTKTLMNNVMIEPVKKIMTKYKGKLPPVPSPDAYSIRLRKLAKQLNLDRVIEKPVKKLDGEIMEKVKLYEMISSKFARSTYYLLGGAMGLSMEHLAKNAGHNSTDIAMKHYFQLAVNYTEKDIQDLLEAFNRK